MKARSQQEMNAQVMRSMFSGTIHNMGNILTMASMTLGEMDDAHAVGSPSLIDMVLDEILPVIENRCQDGSVGKFLTEDPRGSEMLQAMRELLEYQRGVLRRQRTTLDTLADKLNNLNSIISLQQQLLVGMGVTETCDIGAIVDDALKMVGPSATRQGIDVVREINETRPILVDPSALTQVIINVLKNAIEAFEESDTGDSKRIIIAAADTPEGEQGRVSCQIRDNGPGMTKEVAGRIFDFGFSTKRRTRGERGVGLHYCKDTVEDFGGTIVVESELGVGSNFILWLPWATSQSEDEGDSYATVDCTRDD